MNFEKFGREVRSAREAVGLTQKDLAERTGIARQTVTAIENGRPKKPVEPEQVNAFARILGLSVLELVTALGYAVEVAGVEDEREVTLLRLYRATPPPYQRAVLRGLQELAKDGADG